MGGGRGKGRIRTARGNSRDLEQRSGEASQLPEVLKQLSAVRNQSRQMAEDSRAMRKQLADLQSRKQALTKGRDAPNQGAQWACSCGFKHNFGTRLLCYKCAVQRPHPCVTPKQAASGPPSRSSTPQPVSRGTATQAQAASSSAAPSEQEDLEAMLQFFQASLKLADSISNPDIREAKRLECELEIDSYKTRLRASKPLTWQLQSTTTRHQNAAKAQEEAAAATAKAQEALKLCREKEHATQEALEAAKRDLDQVTAAFAAQEAHKAEDISVPADSDLGELIEEFGEDFSTLLAAIPKLGPQNPAAAGGAATDWTSIHTRLQAFVTKAQAKVNPTAAGKKARTGEGSATPTVHPPTQPGDRKIPGAQGMDT